MPRLVASPNLRGTLVRWVLLPALTIAAAFLASWSYRTTLTLERLGERSIIDSTVLLTREKVDRVEQLIISDDNAVAHLVNPDDLDPMASRWTEAADRLSPTVRSIVILDARQRVLRHISRDDEAGAARFRALLARHVLPALQLEQEPAGGHKHLHDEFDGQVVMVSCLTREIAERRYFVVLETDLDYVRDHVLQNLFDDPGARGRFNVVDEDGRLVYGKPLAGAGEYTVSRRFPTTLYKWRLSVSPQAAPELEARARRRRLLDGVLVALSLGVLVAGVAFLAFAARTEERLNRLKSDFIATVSHELRTPLSLIRMFGEMLATERVPTEARRKQYLEIIVRESERLTGLIENVLDFAKLERGKAAYEFHRANLGEVVGRAVEMFRARLDRDRPQLAVQVAAAVPDTDLDERAMQLLLFNLLDNAVKYAGTSDTIAVRVGCSARQQWFEVEDGGPGIHEDDAKRIFERFYRGKSAQSGSARGSGIGLALVKHIADAHGGDVTVRNAPKGGALFTVTLPLRGRYDSPETPDPAEEATGTG